MERDYKDLKWFSEERKQHYAQVNASEEKKQGDKGEKIGKQFLLSLGYEVKDSSAVADAQKHTDLYFRFPKSEIWHSLDVKYKKNFVLEIVNNWGKRGWLFTGAEYILQISQKDDDIYLYKREDMVNYYKDHPDLFSQDYCAKFGKATLWYADYARIAEWMRLKLLTKLR